MVHALEIELSVTYVTLSSDKAVRKACLRLTVWRKQLIFSQDSSSTLKLEWFLPFSISDTVYLRGEAMICTQM